MKLLPYEIWRDIPDYERFYQSSTMGNIRSYHYHKTLGLRNLKLVKDTKGYLKTVLCKNGQHKEGKVHQLVAKTFIPNPNNYPEIDHIDTNRANNQVSNLRWVTKVMNARNPLTYAKRLGATTPLR